MLTFYFPGSATVNGELTLISCCGAENSVFFCLRVHQLRLEDQAQSFLNLLFFSETDP